MSGATGIIFRAFLSTLSLRRATRERSRLWSRDWHFYPRSPCGERRRFLASWSAVLTISIHALLAESDTCRLYRAVIVDISIHALLAESDPIFREVNPGGSKFLSTLSLRRATLAPKQNPTEQRNFYPRSPCGERLVGASQGANSEHISIHALLAESDYHTYT